MLRRAGLFEERPFVENPFSSKTGPDCRSSDASLEAFLFRCRLAWPLASWYTPEVRDEARFHTPDFFPPLLTRPRGRPSGLKKPPLIAAIPPYARHACLADFHFSPGNWSASFKWYCRVSKETRVIVMPLIFRVSYLSVCI